MDKSRDWRLKAAPGGGAAKPACLGFKRMMGVRLSHESDESSVTIPEVRQLRQLGQPPRVFPSWTTWTTPPITGTFRLQKNACIGGLTTVLC